MRTVSRHPHIVARRIAQTLGVSSTIEATTDRSRALDGAAYAISMIQVGGYRPCTVTDFEIPKRYGLRQTIADTLGIGGIMRAVRTTPVLIEAVPGHGTALSGRCSSQLCQPHGDELLGSESGDQDSHRRTLP